MLIEWQFKSLYSRVCFLSYIPYGNPYVQSSCSRYTCCVIDLILPPINLYTQRGWHISESGLCENIYIKSSSCLTENTLHLHYKHTLLMLFLEIIAVYCESRAQPVLHCVCSMHRARRYTRLRIFLLMFAIPKCLTHI